MRKFYCFRFFPALLLLAFPVFLNAQIRMNAMGVKGAVLEVVSEINQDSVRSVISNLQGYGTRFMGNANRRQIYKWIRNKFLSYGFTDVTIDSFLCNTYANQMGLTTQYNVIAKLNGSRYPDQYYIIGGHYDSYARASVLDAPGADDNASGTAAVLEAARVIKKKNYTPAATLLFIAFAAEELMNYGDSGSEHYAAAAKAANMNIKLMINNDMIGYSQSAPAYSNVEVNNYTGFNNIAEFAKDVTRNYTVLNPITGVLDQMSDSYPFFSAGYPVVYFEESVFSPFYHGASDKLSNLNIPYCTEIIKASCATLLSYVESVVSNEQLEKLPSGYKLNQNYPNPFNPSTAITYELPESGYVRLKVFDQLGREAAILVDGPVNAGIHTVYFNGTGLASGNYFYRIETGKFAGTRKFTLLK